MKFYCFLLLSLILLPGCQETPTSTPRLDFATGVRSGLAQTFTLGQLSAPVDDIALLGIDGLTESALSSLDGIMIASLEPNGRERLSYFRSTGPPYADLSAYLRADDGGEGLRTTSEVRFNDVTLSPRALNTVYPYPAIIPFYQPPDFWNDSIYVYGEQVSWNITPASTEGSGSVQTELPDDLFPLGLNDIVHAPERLDTLSIAEGITLTWGNPDPNSYVTINLLVLAPGGVDGGMGYVRTGLVTADDGSHEFTAEDFEQLGIELPGRITFHIIRYTFSVNESLASIGRLGLLNFTHAGVGGLVVD